MRTPVKLRTLTAEEVTEIKRIVSSRKEPIRLVQRARIIAYMLEDSSLYASDAGLKAGYSSVVTGPVWVRRFNEKGLAGLEDQPRPGRKPTHSQEVHSQLVSLAIQKPRSLGYHFGPWDDCRPLFKNGIASISPTQPSGNGWILKDWNGNARKAGSMKPRNTTHSSWKKGEHRHRLPDPYPTHACLLCG